MALDKRIQLMLDNLVNEGISPDAFVADIADRVTAGWMQMLGIGTPEEYTVYAVSEEGEECNKRTNQLMSCVIELTIRSITREVASNNRVSANSLSIISDLGRMSSLLLETNILESACYRAFALGYHTAKQEEIKGD